MATTRSRSTSTTAKRAPARRRSTPATTATSARARAKRVVKAIPTDTRTLTIAGIIAGAIGAGVALFLGRDKVRAAASTGGEKIKQAAEEFSVIAHEKIDQARDNITKFRKRNEPVKTGIDTAEQPYAAVS